MDLSKLLSLAIEQISKITSLDSPDIRLEQAEFNETHQRWEIVVSYLSANTNKKSSHGALGMLASDFQYVRLYKKLHFDSSGKFLGMYMYKD